ncbi:MAG: hypothetical protein ACUVYA_14865 [Planctomycetota bacterium]
MAITVSVPDKIVPGLNHSCTVVTDEGPPRAAVRVGSEVLPHRLVSLGPPKSAADSRTRATLYKVAFYVPEGTAGGTWSFEVESGASRFEASKPVAAL